MSRRYYCDYCDKTFIDDLDGRKKHLTSSHHIKLRNQHYEKYRDPKIILAEESTKTMCHRFAQHGECQFSGNCKYTHYTPEELWSLKHQSEAVEFVEYEEKCRAQIVPEVPSLESWLEPYTRRHKVKKEETDDVGTFWVYPEQLECRSDLPPSLKKFKPEDFGNDDFEQWGV